MTPTFAGRWQTRILLFLFIGLPITVLYAFWFEDGDWRRVVDSPFLVFLCTLFVVGMILDPLYYWVMLFRWDRDWPFAFQFAVMIMEFLIVVALVWFDLLPFLPSSVVFATDESHWWVLLHFTIVFIPSFLALLAVFQVFMIRWRFKGGEWGRL
jgi:hypothetical protein